jgi:hypothetical protein
LLLENSIPLLPPGIIQGTILLGQTSAGRAFEPRDSYLQISDCSTVGGLRAEMFFTVAPLLREYRTSRNYDPRFVSSITNTGDHALLNQ